jgi:hypothetical protein
MRKNPKALLARAKQNRFVAYFPSESVYVNLSGLYDYLGVSYYLSQDLEAQGKRICPTCKEMLDAYISPLCLEKARIAGIPIPSYYISNGYFEPPVIINPVNPFMIKSRTLWKGRRRESTAKSMTRNFTYAISCQEIPANARVKFFRSILDWCPSPRFRELSQAVWKAFRIPLARIRIIQLDTGDMLFSDISPLPFGQLKPNEFAYLEKKVRWEE